MQRSAGSELIALLLLVDAGCSSALWQRAVALHHTATTLLALCCAACKGEGHTPKGAEIKAIAVSCLKLFEEFAVVVDILLSCILSRNLRHLWSLLKLQGLNGVPAAKRMVYQPLSCSAVGQGACMAPQPNNRLA